MFAMASRLCALPLLDSAAAMAVVQGVMLMVFVTERCDRILIWITPGHIFGAAALSASTSTYLASTEAVRNSIVLVWDGPTIRALARRFPRLMINAFHTTIDYLSWYIGTHAGLNVPECSGEACPCTFGIHPQHRPKGLGRH
jgi:hypothetical protein